MSEKKRVCKGSWVGYCPFPSLGHDTVYCIVTKQGHQAMIRPSWCVLGSAAGSRYGHDMATIRPITRPRYGLPANGACSSARAHSLARGESRYKNYIVAGGDFWVTIQHVTWQRVHCDRACARDTARNARGMGLGVTIQFCIATEGEGGDTARGDLRHDAQAPR